MSQLFSVLRTLAVIVPGAAAATFSFDTLPPGTAVSFSGTADGITATFSSPTASNFQVMSSTFSTLTGQVLKSDDPQPDVLEIAFDRSLSSATVRFAVHTDLPGAPVGYIPPVSLDAYLGGVPAGSTTVIGTVPGAPFFSAEGVLAISGSSFDSVRISTGAFDFAIDDVVVTAIPEPRFLVLPALLVLGACGLFKERFVA